MITDKATCLSCEPIISEVKLYDDSRGFFFPILGDKDLANYGFESFPLKGLNMSQSKQGVIRGLHAQHNFPQDKIITVVEGEILDVIIDCRSSQDLGRVTKVELSDGGKNQIFVPKGFLHGFQVLSPTAKIVYAVSERWVPTDEIRVNPFSLGDDFWTISRPQAHASEPDLKGESLHTFLERIKTSCDEFRKSNSLI